MKNFDGLRNCSRKCMNNKTQCKDQTCRLWQDYPDEYNCTLVSVYENGPMTLREVAEREHLSFARIKQIESKALKKLKSLNLIGCFRFQCYYRKMLLFIFEVLSLHKENLQWLVRNY